MSSVVIAIIAIVVLAIVYVTYNKLQVEKAKAAQLLALNNSVRKIQDGYKSQVSALNSSGVIDTESRRRLVMVANNYFVFQPVNSINISHLNDLTDLFLNAVQNYQASENSNEEVLADFLAKLANALPENTRDYTATYYLNIAPGLFYDFATALEESVNADSSEEPSSEEDAQVSVDEASDIASSEEAKQA